MKSLSTFATFTWRLLDPAHRELGSGRIEVKSAKEESYATRPQVFYSLHRKTFVPSPKRRGRSLHHEPPDRSILVLVALGIMALGGSMCQVASGWVAPAISGSSRIRRSSASAISLRAASAAAAASSASGADDSTASTRRKAGKFQSGSYDRPIVPPRHVRPRQRIAPPRRLPRRQPGKVHHHNAGSVLPTLGSSATSGDSATGGEAVILTPHLLRSQMESGVLTRSTVAVIDFGHPALNDPPSQLTGEEESAPLTVNLTANLTANPHGPDGRAGPLVLRRPRPPVRVRQRPIPSRAD